MHWIWLTQREHRGDYPGAEEALRTYLQQNPTSGMGVPEVRIALGNLLIETGRAAEAVECLQQAHGAHIGAEYESALSESLAVAHLRIRADNELVPASERAAIFERFAQGHAAMARWQDALETLEQALALDGQRVDARLLQILIHRRWGEREQALGEIDALFDLLRRQWPDPKQRLRHPAHAHAFAQLLLIRLPDALQQDKPVIVEADGRTVRIDPGDPAAYALAVDLLRKDGLRGVALQLLRLAVKQHRTSAPLWLNLGVEAEAFGCFQEALEGFTRASKLARVPEALAGVARIERILASEPID